MFPIKKGITVGFIMTYFAKPLIFYHSFTGGTWIHFAKKML